MSSLFTSKIPGKISVHHMTKDKTTKTMDIYEDYTISELFMKLSVIEKISQSQLYIWYVDSVSQKVVSLEFEDKREYINLYELNEDQYY